MSLSIRLNKRAQALVELIRPYNATAALLALSIGFFFPSTTKNFIDFLLALIILALLNSIATTQNDIEDIKLDKVNAQGKPLQTNLISLPEAKKLKKILIMITFGLSIIHPYPNLLFFLIFMAISFMYNTRPFLLSYRPFSSIIALGLFYTLLPMLYGYEINNQNINTIFLGLLISWFLVRLSISILKDYKDEIGDNMFHKKTFYLTYGKKITARLSFALAVVGYTGIFLISLPVKKNNLLILLPLIFAVIGFLPRLILLSTKKSKRANELFHRIFFSENRFEGVYLLWLIFG